MFLLRKSAIEQEHAMVDAPLINLYHGTKPKNVLGIAAESFNRNFGRSAMYTPISFTNQNVMYLR